MNFMKLARVVDTHPESNSVDIVMVDDGARYPGVEVCTPFGTTNSGVSDLPDVTKTGNKWSLTESTDCDMRAIVAFIGAGVPVVLGFLFPPVNQVLFADRNRRIERHASDVYTSTDKDGNFELYHPSGTYLRIGTAPAHEDLTGLDYDAKWAITKNTDKAVHVHLSVRNAGNEVSRLDMNPQGDIEVQCDRDLSATVGRDATVSIGRNLAATVAGGASVSVSGNLTSSAASWSHTGPVSITGDVTIAGDVATTGTLKNNSKDVGSGHRHSGVQSGLSNTGAPV